MSYVSRGLLILLVLGCVTTSSSALEPAGGSSLSGGGLDADDILPVDDAFRFGGYPEDDGAVVFWQVMPGYYLYRDKISFSLGGEAVAVELPRGKMRLDEVFGEVEVIEGLVEVRLPVRAESLVVNYQGCAEQGYCYPPQSRSLNFSEIRLNGNDLLKKSRKPL